MKKRRCQRFFAHFLQLSHPSSAHKYVATHTQTRNRRSKTRAFVVVVLSPKRGHTLKTVAMPARTNQTKHAKKEKGNGLHKDLSVRQLRSLLCVTSPSPEAFIHVEPLSQESVVSQRPVKLQSASDWPLRPRWRKKDRGLAILPQKRSAKGTLFRNLSFMRSVRGSVLFLRVITVLL